MIKCKIDRGKGPVKVKAKGDVNTITVEMLALVHEVYQVIARKSPEAAKEFRNRVIGVMLDPRSPLWKEEE